MKKINEELSNEELKEYRKLVLEENIKAIMLDARKFLDSIEELEEVQNNRKVYILVRLIKD